MGKKLLKVLTALCLALTLSLTAFACGEVSWKDKVTLTKPGDVLSNGGFLVETTNYVYFINGSETYTAENKFGTPVKGAIMVAEKSKLGSEDIVYQTVVPNVIANGDYGAGIYVYGDSIYYATPSVKKDSNGEIANNYLEFRSMKLDGSGKVTDYLTISGNDTQFRFVEKAGVVYIVYYDSNESSIVSYNTSNKASLTVVESPASYTFVDNEAINDAVVIYTESGKDQNNETDSTFNLVYAYTVGEEKATLVANGSEVEGAISVNYAISFVSGNFVFYTATSSSDSSVKTYGNTIDKFVNEFDTAVEYKKDTFVKNTSLIINLNTAYAVDGGYLCEINLGTNEKTRKQTGDISTLLFKNGNYVYYTNTNTELCRVDVSDVAKSEEKVSNGAINATWYDVACVGNFAIYLDNTTYGSNYLAYVDMSATAKGEDTDDDNEKDVWFIEEDKIYSLGVISSSDQVERVVTLIEELSSISKLTVEDGVIAQKEEVEKVRAEYNKLTNDQKEEISEDLRNKIDTYEGYINVSEKLVALMSEYLDEFGNIKVEVTDANKAEIQGKLDEITTLTEEYTTTDDAYLVENGLWTVQELQELIDDLTVEE